MKVLIAHNSYQQAGGEDNVLSAELKLLKVMRHDVRLFCASNETINGFWGRFKTALLCKYSVQSKKLFRKKINTFHPDIVHVHNFFPLLTPSIYDACLDTGIPVVQTLHNFRTICASALLLRDSVICEKCLKNSPYCAVLHRCYRNSYFGSFSVARMVAYHRKKQTWQHKVDCFIALTRFARDKFIEAGFPAEKIIVKPNFCKITRVESEELKKKEGALFVGRLSQEKGIATMLEAWQDLDIPLQIAGGGPLFDSRQGKCDDYIKFLGQIDSDQVAEEMKQAAFLLMPSEWYEGFPMVLVESFAHGLPVVTSRLGSMAEIVQDGVTGLHFEPGNPQDLAEKVQWMHNHPDECRQMGKNARKEYEQKYTPEKNYEMLMDIYQKTIENYEIRHS